MTNSDGLVEYALRSAVATLAAHSSVPLSGGGCSARRCLHPAAALLLQQLQFPTVGLASTVTVYCVEYFGDPDAPGAATGSEKRAVRAAAKQAQNRTAVA